MSVPFLGKIIEGKPIKLAYQKGKATDPVKYFADPQNRDLGMIKQQRKPNIKLIVVPFPDRQRGTNQFFFHNSLQPS